MTSKIVAPDRAHEKSAASLAPKAKIQSISIVRAPVKSVAESFSAKPSQSIGPRAKAWVRRVIPRKLLATYHDQRRVRGLRQTVTLDGIKQVLDSLGTVSVESYAKNFLKGRGRVSELPPGMGEIEINDSCNIDCVMCKTSLSKRPKGLMDPDLFEYTIKRMVGQGMRDTTLHTIGDPLANKRLPIYLGIMRKHGAIVGKLSTNGLLLQRHMDTLFEYRDVILGLRPSIDGASKQVYEKIRAGGKWEDLHANLLAFAERNLRTDRPFFVDVSNVMSKDNFHEIAFIPSAFSYLTAAYNFNFNFINSLSPDNDYFLAANYFDTDFHINSPCSMLWDSLYILKDGSLTTCCRDYDGDLVFGNIKDGNLEDAYNNPKLQSIRDSHLENNNSNKPELCKTCYLVDQRLSRVIDDTIQYFFLNIRKHPAVLQASLNKIGPALKSKKYGEVFDLIKAL